ncbi:MAG: RNA helicase, partial [Betaproteobacteria bacterium]|nr:RNA helicase [Betaproteobacteria bacterium]
DERLYLRDIEKLIKREIDKETLPGFEPIHTAAVSPPPQRRGGNQQRQGQPGNGGNRGGRGGSAKPQGTAAAAKPGHRSGQRHH